MLEWRIQSAAMGILSLITGKAGASGFGSASTAEQVTDGVDASRLTVVITGNPLNHRQICRKEDSSSIMTMMLEDDDARTYCFLRW